MDKYEAAYGVGGTRGNWIARANSDYGIVLAGEALVVSALDLELSQAYDYLTETYITDKEFGITVNWDHIYVGENNGENGTQDTRYYKGTDADPFNLIGSDGSDLIFGESGSDLVNGGAGDDVLYGGSGDDTVRGDRGNDFLIGESGDDHYYIGSLDGNDTIIDPAGTGKIISDSGG